MATHRRTTLAHRLTALGAPFVIYTIGTASAAVVIAASFVRVLTA